MSDSSDDEAMREVREAALRARRAKIGGDGSGSPLSAAPPPPPPPPGGASGSPAIRAARGTSDSDDTSDDSDDSSGAKRRRAGGGGGGGGAAGGGDSSNSGSDSDGLPSAAALRAKAARERAAADAAAAAARSKATDSSRIVDAIEAEEKRRAAGGSSGSGSGAAQPPEDDGPYSTTKMYGGMLLKAAKYTKKWVPRYVTVVDNVVTYSVSEGGPPKEPFTYNRVVRGAERRNAIHSLILEGEKGPKREPVALTFNCESRAEFDKWYRRFANPLIHSKQMDPINWDCPKEHPKTHLPILDVPLEHLATFAPLDRLILHYFSIVTVTQIKSGAVAGAIKLEETLKQCVFIGDRMLYVCKMDANISRCVAMQDIVKVFCVGGKKAPAGASGSSGSGGGGGGPSPAASSVPPPPPAPAGGKKPGPKRVGGKKGGAKGDDDDDDDDGAKKTAGASPAAASSASTSAAGAASEMTIGVQCLMPEYDILFSTTQDDGENFISVLQTIHRAFSGHGTDLERRDLERVELLKPQLSLVQNAYFTLKITLPMSKKFLAKSIEEWKKRQETGAPNRRAGSIGPGGAPLAAMSAAAAGAASSGATAATVGGAGDGQPAPYSPLAKLGAAVTPGSPPANGPSNPMAAAVGSPKLGTANSFTKGATPLLSPNNGPSSSGGKIVIPHGIDKMQRLLIYVGLPQYYAVLQDRFVDWDVFSCMDATDLAAKGITNPAHQTLIENALNDQAFMKALQQADDAAFNNPANGPVAIKALPAPATAKLVVKRPDLDASAALGTGGPNGGKAEPIIDEDAL